MKSTDVFPSKYLKAEELEEDITLTMSRVELETMKTQKGEEQSKPVLYFDEIDKGLVLNKTNWGLISKQHGDESDEWTGKQVTLTVVDVDSFGDVVSAIRVKPQRKVASNPIKVKNGNGNGSKPASQPMDAITAFWKFVNDTGYDREAAKTLINENAGDFAAALKILQAA